MENASESLYLEFTIYETEYLLYSSSMVLPDQVGYINRGGNYHRQDYAGSSHDLSVPVI
jgi:hypothetical protein